MDNELSDLGKALASSPLHGNFWLIGGAVLGYRRAGKMLLHDKDLDFGISDPALLKSSLGQLESHGFKPQSLWRNNDGVPTEWVFIRNGRKIEFFRHFIRDEYYRWYAYHAQRRIQLIREMCKYQLTSVDFLNQSWLMPADLESYLQQQYGNWKVECKKWNYVTDCPCNISTIRWKGTRHWDLNW